VALLLRILYWIAYWQSPLANLYRTDQKFYRDWGLHIAEGNWWGAEVFVQGPLYAYLLGCWFWLFDQSDAVLLLMQSFIGSLTCLLIYLSARQLFGTATALVAGLCCAIFGPLVFYDVMIMKSFLSPFLTSAVLYSGLCFQNNQRGFWLFLSGVCVGLGILLRENHLLLLVPLVILVFHSTASWKGRLAHLSCLAGGCLLIVSPAILRNTSIAGEPVFITTGGGEVFYMAHGPEANGYYSPPWFVRPDPTHEHDDFLAEARSRSGNPDLTPAQSSRFWYREAFRSVVANPLRTLHLTFIKLLILLNDYEVPDSENYSLTREFVWPLNFYPSFGWFTGLGVLGLIVALPDWKKLNLPIGLLLAHIASVLLTYNFARFRIGMMPLWLMFTALGLHWLWHAWFIQASNRWARIVAALAVVLISLFSMLPPGGGGNADENNAEHSLRRLLQARQRTLENVRQARQSLNHNPNDTDAKLRLAVGLMQLQHFPQATDVLKSLLEHNPQYAEVHRLLGTSYGQQQLWNAAIKHLTQAHQLEPANPDTLNNLGTACFEQAQNLQGEQKGKLRSLAAQYWEQALQIDINHTMARYNLARHWMALEKYPQAIQVLRQLTEKNPAFKQTGLLLEQLVVNPAASLSKSDLHTAAESLERMALAYINAGRVTEAIHTIRIAITAAERSGDDRLLERIKTRLQKSTR